MKMKTGLQKAVEIMGGYKPLAAQLGIDRNAIRRWRAVPARWIIRIEHLTGVPREELRPDLYLAPRPRAHARVGRAAR
jgi:DNA-binding transcriptional regulator YdaS (Cro superfamily)